MYDIKVDLLGNLRSTGGIHNILSYLAQSGCGGNRNSVSYHFSSQLLDSFTLPMVTKVDQPINSTRIVVVALVVG